jgi:sensor histidine kinase YesM
VSQDSHDHWRQIIIANLIASAIVLFVFSGASWRTPLPQLLRGYAIAFLFSSCIGPMLGVAMPRIAPHVWRSVRFPFNWLVIALVMVILSIAGSAVAIATLVAIGYVAAADFTGWFFGSMRIAIAVTLTMGLFITAYELMRARLAQTAAQAQFASLESRVQPHFLFNTLNSIAALIHEDPKGAERMTGQLASLLRSSLDQQATPLVALNDELRTVRDYLAIEQVRFGERLRYTIDVAPDAEFARVPRMSIQTLVENSVKYAVSARRDGATIAIAAAAAPKIDSRRRAVAITVEDDGPGFDASALPSGHGLTLLRDRLALLFRDAGSMRVASAPGRTAVTLTVPETHDVAPGAVRS